jgi:hypothetical protein
MDAELKEYLQGMEARMSATVEARIVESEARMKEHTETVETRLLSEFWKWARTTDMKARLQNNHVIGLEERIGSVEERIRELEFRRPV